MANSLPSLAGQVNGAGDTTALHLKVFSNETLAAFLRQTQMLDKVLTKTITSGKSAQFPAMGKVKSGIHVPGEQLLGNEVKHAERVISIDGLLVADVFIDALDEAMAAYDTRSMYTAEMSSRLSNDIDTALMREAIKAARSTATVEGLPDGTTIVNTNLASTDDDVKADAIAKSIFAAAAVLDKNDVIGQKYAMLSSDDYYTLVQSNKAVNRDFNDASNGSYSEGKVFSIAGVNIIKSNNVPNDDSTVTDTLHGVDATKTQFIVFVQSAVGLVKLRDLSSESAYDISKQGSLLVSKLAVGAGVLRPEAAVEVANAV